MFWIKLDNNRSIIDILIVSGVTAMVVSTLMLGVVNFYFQKEQPITIEHINSTPVNKALFTLDQVGTPVHLDFTNVAAKVTDAVVHIKSVQSLASNNSRHQYERGPNPFEDFFNDSLLQDFFNQKFFYRQNNPNQNKRPQAKIGQGSGVIINKDGYIVTNYHVIANADDLEVTLADNRTFKATIIGTDPTTDLALLQIKAEDLATLPIVDSDQVRVGEWVMAVGNPFNLTSTVTAGIVSAKGRNINILKEQFAVESFIQTDAAINPGNSGGALVNLQGGLIGINTAIASPTGTYSGYGFAVPSNIVGKVVEDLIRFGVVQRGVLGVMIRTVDSKLKEKKRLEVNKGVYIDSLLENSAAGAAGLAPGDVILSVNDLKVNTSAELQELITRYRPGDEVELQVNRKGELKQLKVTLNNREGNTTIEKKEFKEILNILGAYFQDLDSEVAEQLGIEGGVKVTALFAGKLRQQTRIKAGFIITKVDGQPIKKVKDLARKLESKKGGVMLEGIYTDLPGVFYYAFGL